MNPRSPRRRRLPERIVISGQNLIVTTIDLHAWKWTSRLKQLALVAHMLARALQSWVGAHALLENEPSVQAKSISTGCNGSWYF